MSSDPNSYQSLHKMVTSHFKNCPIQNTNRRMNQTMPVGTIYRQLFACEIHWREDVFNNFIHNEKDNSMNRYAHILHFRFHFHLPLSYGVKEITKEPNVLISLIPEAKC